MVASRLPRYPSVSLSVWLKIGSRWEFAGERGYSHFTEHMLFRGTRRRSGRQIAGDIDRLGGEVNAATSKDHTYYNANVVFGRLSEGLELLSDLVFEASFPRREYERERGVILEEIKSYEDVPDEFVFDKLSELVYRRHPLGGNILGTRRSIREASRDRLVRFYRDVYRPEELLLSVSGNFDKSRLAALAEKFFGEERTRKIRVKKGSNQQRRESFPVPHFQPVRRHLKRKLKQVHYCLAFPALTYHSPWRPALAVLDQILAGGFASILYQRLRERMGLCYMLESFQLPASDTGLYGIYCATSPGNFVKSLDEIRRGLDQVLKGRLRRNILDEAKEALTGRLALAMDTAEAMMMTQAFQEIHYNRFKNTEQRIREIQAVTVGDIRSLLRQMVGQERPALVSLGALSQRAAAWQPAL